MFSAYSRARCSCWICSLRIALDAVADRTVQEVPVHLALDEVGVRALAQGVDRHLLVGEAGDHDHRDVRGDGADLDQGGEAVAVGQVQVEQDRVERPFGESVERVGEPVDRDHLVALGVHLGEHLADEPGVARVVLDQQYPERLWVRGHRLHVPEPGRSGRTPSGSLLTGFILAHLSRSGDDKAPDSHSSPEFCRISLTRRAYGLYLRGLVYVVCAIRAEEGAGEGIGSGQTVRVGGLTASPPAAPGRRATWDQYAPIEPITSKNRSSPTGLMM